MHARHLMSGRLTRKAVHLRSIRSLLPLVLVATAVIGTAIGEQPQLKSPDPDRKSFELTVVDPDDQPVAGAVVEIRTRPKLTAEWVLHGQFDHQASYGAFLRTADDGRIVLSLPAASARRLDVSIKTDGYGPYWSGWNGSPTSGDLPDSFTARLDAGRSIGGRVVDEQGNPIEGASVHLSVAYKKRPGDTAALHVGREFVTNPEGKWVCHFVPTSMHSVGAEITHPQYQPTRESLSVDLYGIDKDQDGSATITMSQGLVVTLGLPGSQISIQNGSIDDGSTYAARVDTDAEGKFSFPPQGGDYQLVITHRRGYAHIKATAEDRRETIQLSPWGRVQGTFAVAGRPVPGITMTLSTNAIHSYGRDVPNIFAHYETVSGKEGRFAFGRVFPGRGSISRQILMMVSDGAKEVTSAAVKPIDVIEDETSEIDFGAKVAPWSAHSFHPREPIWMRSGVLRSSTSNREFPRRRATLRWRSPRRPASLPVMVAAVDADRGG